MLRVVTGLYLSTRRQSSSQMIDNTFSPATASRIFRLNKLGIHHAINNSTVQLRCGREIVQVALHWQFVKGNSLKWTNERRNDTKITRIFFWRVKIGLQVSLVRWANSLFIGWSRRSLRKDILRKHAMYSKTTYESPRFVSRRLTLSVYIPMYSTSNCFERSSSLFKSYMNYVKVAFGSYIFNKESFSVHFANNERHDFVSFCDVSDRCVWC